MDEKIVFTTDEGEELELSIIEETKLNGIEYLLVADFGTDEDEGDCYIMKDTSSPEAEEAEYEFVEDEKELDALFDVFKELISDADIKIVM